MRHCGNSERLLEDVVHWIEEFKPERGGGFAAQRLIFKIPVVDSNNNNNSIAFS